MGEIRRFAIADACSVYGESLRTKPTVATSASIVRERKEMTGLITAPAGTTLCGARPPRRLQIGSRIARLVWGFSCQVVVLVCCRFLFGAARPFFVPSPAIRFAERAEEVKGPKR